MLALGPDDCQWYGTMASTMTDQSNVSAVAPESLDRSWWQTFRSWPAWARVPVYIAAGLVLLLVVGLVTGVVLARRPLPQTDGTLDLPGLQSSVTVIRDDHGIPQLYGDSLEDLMRAQGFVHAQERFFEMDVRRHVTAGRLWSCSETPPSRPTSSSAPWAGAGSRRRSSR